MLFQRTPKRSENCCLCFQISLSLKNYSLRSVSSIICLIWLGTSVRSGASGLFRQKARLWADIHKNHMLVRRGFFSSVHTLLQSQTPNFTSGGFYFYSTWGVLHTYHGFWLWEVWNVFMDGSAVFRCRSMPLHFLAANQPTNQMNRIDLFYLFIYSFIHSLNFFRKNFLSFSFVLSGCLSVVVYNE